jgi:hypothetical protein
MKKMVIQQLEQRGLKHIFNETEFNTYKKKATGGRGYNNNYMLALNIMDMFILNSRPVVHAEMS